MEKSNMSLHLVCPHDHHSLSETEANASCVECGRQYPIQEGVVCTLERPNEFYEGAYGNKIFFLPRNERLWHVWPIWLINGGYLWNVRSSVPSGATVVELGCSAGVRYFGRRYRMVGCDLSLASLKKLEFYERRIQADATISIPLPDNSADAVVSAYFWEHIPPSLKPNILRECKRVLKPGGKIIFLYDVETQNPLIRYYKKMDMALYEKLFLTGDSHFGYQKPTENLTIFKEGGFRIIKHQGMEKTFLQSSSAYIKLAQFRTKVRCLFVWAERLGRHPFFYPYTVLMRLIDTFICPALPDDWARMDMVVCEKSIK